MTRLGTILGGAAVAMLAILAGLSTSTPAFAGDWTGNANFFLGQKSLDSDDWEPLENQGEFGAEVSWGKKAWPILIATDVLISGDSDEISGNDVDAGTASFTETRGSEFSFSPLTSLTVLNFVTARASCS